MTTALRYRLRFLLQEIDLPPGETILGRSATCHVTIEDPLVSRQHARILVQGERASIQDMGSRNGLLVNGKPAGSPVELHDGDRVRIGTQELVFCAVRAQSRPGVGPGTRPTGFMCHCAHCGLPYPAEILLCPACGSRERMDEDTISGVVGESDKNWTLELLVDVLEKAVSLDRWDDVERMLGRAQGNVEERLQAGQPKFPASTWTASRLPPRRSPQCAETPPGDGGFWRSSRPRRWCPKRR